MRILHVIPAVAPVYGGPSVSIWPLAAALRGQNDMVIDIAATDANGRGRRLTEKDFPFGAGTVHLFRKSLGETFKYSPHLGRWIFAHARDYDLIHAHGHWNYPTAIACQAARQTKIPYVLSPHGMLSPYSWHRSRWKKQVYWWLIERRNVCRAAGFHVTSAGEKRELLQLAIQTPIEIILPGLADDVWKTPADPGWLRQQLPHAGDGPIVLFLSRLHPKKGLVEFLLPAFRAMKSNSLLAIAGAEDPTVPGYKDRIVHETKRLGLQERVALLGYVPPAKRWACFDGADVFILPSHSENFGLVVPEAMARGVPVLVTSGVQVAEHVIASGGGMVVSPDATAIAQALDVMRANPEARRAMGEKGRQYARQTFSWQTAAEQLAELYRRIVHKRAKP